NLERFGLMADDFNGIRFPLATLGGNKKHGKRIEFERRNDLTCDSKEYRIRAFIPEVDHDRTAKLPLLAWLFQTNRDAATAAWRNTNWHASHYQGRSQLHVFDCERF